MSVGTLGAEEKPFNSLVMKFVKFGVFESLVQTPSSLAGGSSDMPSRRITHRNGCGEDICV